MSRNVSRARIPNRNRSSPTTPEEFAKFIARDRRAAEKLISIAKTPKTQYREH